MLCKDCIAPYSAISRRFSEPASTVFPVSCRQAASQRDREISPHRLPSPAGSTRGEKFGLDQADDCWPDILLLLEAGIVVLKDYEAHEEAGISQGELRRFSLGEDALLFFTDAFLRGLVVRSVYVESPLDLAIYGLRSLGSQHVESVSFPLTCRPGRRYVLRNDD